MRVVALTFGCAFVSIFSTGADMAQAQVQKTQAIRYPWAGTDDEIIVNLAIGNLRDSMIKMLTSERGVHAETLLVSIGAVAGFAAQVAVDERIKNRDIPGATKDMSREELSKLMHDRGYAVVVTAKSGEQYQFGDLINGYLVNQTTTVNYHLFGILAAAAAEAGAKYETLPDPIPVFRRASQTIGTPDYGMLNPPKPLSPHYTPREALNKFWPAVTYLFERRHGLAPAQGRSVKREYWPLMTAIVARQFLLWVKDTIEPRVGLALIMESAIVMSKIDPKSVPQAEKETAQ